MWCQLAARCLFLGVAASLVACADPTVDPGEPQVRLSEGLAFGEVLLGMRATQAVALTHEGGRALQITSARLEGSPAFSVEFTPGALVRDAALSWEVAFQPRTPGAHEAALILSTDRPSVGELKVSLSGSGDPSARCAPCEEPPVASCGAEDTLAGHTPRGTCADGQCRYVPRDLACAAGCDPEAGACADVACEEPGSPLRVTHASGDSEWTSLAWNGEEYGVAWTEGREGGTHVYFARLSPTREKLGADVRVSVQPSARSPSVAWTGHGWAIAWTESPSVNEQLNVAVLSPDGETRTGPVQLTSWQGDSRFPSVAWNPQREELGIAFTEVRGVDQKIFFVRAGRDGTKLGPEAAISGNPAPFAADGASLVWTGREWGVAWSDSRYGDGEIFFARLSPTGERLGSELRVTDAESTSTSPSLAWTGQGYGLAWNDYRTGSPQVFFALLSAQGLKLGAELQVSNDDVWAVAPRLAWGRHGYGIIWTRYQSDEPGLYFARLTAVGALGEERRVVPVYSAFFPNLVFGAGHFATTWHHLTGDGGMEVFLETVCP